MDCDATRKHEYKTTGYSIKPRIGDGMDSKLYSAARSKGNSWPHIVERHIKCTCCGNSEYEMDRVINLTPEGVEKWNRENR